MNMTNKNQPTGESTASREFTPLEQGFPSYSEGEITKAYQLRDGSIVGYCADTREWLKWNSKGHLHVSFGKTRALAAALKGDHPADWCDTSKRTRTVAHQDRMRAINDHRRAKRQPERKARKHLTAKRQRNASKLQNPEAREVMDAERCKCGAIAPELCATYGHLQEKRGGSQVVDRSAIALVATPEPTQTWTPIPHTALIDRVEETLRSDGLTITKQAHNLTKDGARYFGLMQVANGQNSEDYAWVLGLRNSHDKRFPAGLVVGASVFVCDNLSFSGEIRFARKHTRHIMRDLPALTQRAIGQLMQRWHSQDQRIEAYKQNTLSDGAAHDLVVRALDVRVVGATALPAVLEEWRKPRFEAFQPRTAWSLFNSFTQVLKGCSLAALPARTERLHGLFDAHVGLHSLS